MTIQYASDLHLEFTENSEFLTANPILPVGDILVLCGDIDCLDKSGNSKHPFWDWASKMYLHVLVVPGNHEFYNGFDIKQIIDKGITSIRKNIYLCYNHTITIENIDFIMTTLWSEINEVNSFTIERFINDYKHIIIEGKVLTTKKSNSLHNDCIKYLENEFDNKKSKKRIVVTHHAPTKRCIPLKYSGSNFNDAFYTNLDKLIESSKADYWIYGHSHFNCNQIEIGQTKLITNQLGYVSLSEHLSFKNSCRLQL